LIHKSKQVSRSINEAVRSINTIKAEEEYIEHKFPDKANYINTNTRVNIKGLIKTPAAFKCYCTINAYSQLDAERNQNTKSKECLHYSKTESW